MAKASAITKGNFLEWRGEPVLVVDKEFYTPGKGASVVRLKLKNLRTNNVVKEVIRTDDSVEEIHVEHRRVQYLYKSGDQFVFMDPRSYEQVEVNANIVDDVEKFIKEGEEYTLAIWNNEVVSIDPPKKIVFEVVYTEDAVRGDTATNATKPAKLDNGYEVKVPLFIKKGEKIIVNTETGEYVSRKN